MATLEQVERDGMTIVRICGSLAWGMDLEEIEERFVRVVRRPGARVVVDLAAVDVVATPAIAMFVASARAAQRNGGKIVFTQSSPRVADVLHRLRLDTYLLTVPEIEDALQMIREN